MPFGPYEDFDDCVAKNQDKADPKAYCAAIENATQEEKAQMKSPTRAKVGGEIVRYSRAGGVPIRVTTHATLRQEGEGLKTAPNGQPYDHRFIASTERLASDGGVILTSAWVLDAYLKRPRWIAMHDIWGDGKLPEITLGKTVDIRIEEGLPVDQTGPTGRGLVAYVSYAPTKMGQEVKLLYEVGGLDDVSVRWDWRTEELRNPFEEEASVYGDDLYWIATRADLIELSSVLFGADPGAQMIRADLEMAFERCRSAGTALPHIEKFMTGLLPLQIPVVGLRTETPHCVDCEEELDDETLVKRKTADGVVELVCPKCGERGSEATSGTPDGTPSNHRQEVDAEVEEAMGEVEGDVDATAVGDALDQLDNVMNAFDAWIQAGSTIRDSLGDAMTNISNLLQAADEADRGTKITITASAMREALEETLDRFLVRETQRVVEGEGDGTPTGIRDDTETEGDGTVTDEGKKTETTEGQEGTVEGAEAEGKEAEGKEAEGAGEGAGEGTAGAEGQGEGEGEGDGTSTPEGEGAEGEEEGKESTTDAEGDEEPFMDVEAVLADSKSATQGD